MNDQDTIDELSSVENENLTFSIIEPDVNFEDVYAESAIEDPVQEEVKETHEEPLQEQVQEYVPEETPEEPVQEQVQVQEEAHEEPLQERSTSNEVPQIVFIVPYRDRESHYKLFSSHMKMILQNSIPYKIFYIHQKDKRGFNRGAMKNIGFLVVKQLYSNYYKNITLVFNDIDTMPAKDTVLDYFTSQGIIKHFYGFEYTLGGIVSINASDFEKLNGFPNFWAWGYEDNLLQIRAEKYGIKIDRSCFYKIYDPAIIYLVDTPMRDVNRGEYDRFLHRTQEGISSIQGLNYNVDDQTGFINVLQFSTSDPEVLEKRTEYDLRNGPAPFKVKKPQRRVPSMKMHF